MTTDLERSFRDSQWLIIRVPWRVPSYKAESHDYFRALQSRHDGMEYKVPHCPSAQAIYCVVGFPKGHRDRQAIALSRVM